MLLSDNIRVVYRKEKHFCFEFARFFRKLRFMSTGENGCRSFKLSAVRFSQQATGIVRNDPNQPILEPFTLMPGPIVDAMTQLLMYCPFAAAGLALIIAPISVLKFSESFSEPKEAFPMGQWMMFVLSRRY